MPVYSVAGRVALVTGAARGIGLETARELHARGASVVLVDLDPDAVQVAAEQVGARALGIGADVTDRAAMADAVAAAVERFGGLDVVVANAGIAPPAATMTTIDPDDFERVVEVDLLGVWRTVHPALAQVVARGGHIVVVASVYAFMNGVMLPSYAMSKAGVEQLGRALRVELAPHGASASVAYFGFIDTEMVREGFADPLARRFEELFPKFMGRRLPASAAGKAIADGIERRAPRIVAPAFWKVWSHLRGLLNPLGDRIFERDRRVRELISELEQRGPVAGPTPPATVSRSR